jgi:hypothetical protein
MSYLDRCRRQERRLRRNECQWEEEAGISLAWYIACGGWPTYLCHACDNPLCVAVRHLIPGDASFNAYDRDIKKKGGFMVNSTAPDTCEERLIDPAPACQDTYVETGPSEPPGNNGP